MKNLKKCWILVLISLLVISCSKNKNSRYKDVSYLEKPPVMPIIEKQPKTTVEEDSESENKGLGNDVILTEVDQRPIIKIKKSFDRSWDVVEQALVLKEIEISDKNRDKGIFYIKFDPDTKSDSSFFDAMTFFLFKDEYAEAIYKLTVQWQESDSVITIQPIDSEESDLLDDDGDDFNGSIDEGVILMNTLYKTIRDDLPH